jgi:hypothetical protein
VDSHARKKISVWTTEIFRIRNRQKKLKELEPSEELNEKKNQKLK